ncbi:hypothetical protein RclHR1_26030001 [Rhizophagus clarus]|uniref:Uncharacterized protein n=1 Tax=Rhizophagus clarus TaxID=94130 RepID=A0A2Z6RCR5_9GLOM|nr:hypothetical protein RclHR1_26030001 [Rhizophagus clarus]GES87565.1 hypothetical protein GLOIN_2v1884604 [Rhizophagus clarus]
METINVQPLALVHNNEIVYIEGNTANVQNKFSCFKIFKLKGPIDVNYLLNIIFPPSERDYYNLEVSDYDGKSAKVKFNFANRTHTDLIRHLQESAAKFFDISENGLLDWLASDTVTFRTVYQNTDAAASQQHRINKILSSDVTTSTSSSSSPIPHGDLNLYPIIDEKAIELELNELSRKISSKTTLKNYELERLFHNTFQRRDMTVTITDLTDKFFGQIRNVVAFIGSDKPNSVIEDNFMMDSNTIVHNFARLLYQHAQNHINVAKDGLIMGFVKNYQFGIILTLWNLINAFHSIQQSYQVLIDTDEEFKKILKSQKSDFTDHLSIMDKTLMDLLIILYDVIDQEKYERLQRRLEHFVTSAEDLMKLVMIINNDCNKEIEKLEDQKKDVTSKLYTAAITVGITAIVIGGYIYNKKLDNKDFEKYEKWIGNAAICATGTASTYIMYNGYSTRSKLENSIQKHTSILEQLQSAYKELKNWKILGKRYIQKDIDDMNNNRMTLIEEFVRIRNQCKCLGDIFNSLD